MISPAQDTLRLWFSTVSESTLAAEQAVCQLLSVSERARLDSIGSTTRRREYLLSRATMRHALSHNFLRQQQEWLVEDRPRSTPVVSNLPAGAHIGLSHSKGFICFAISACPLGIDLEHADRERDFEALAEVFMNNAEQTNLAANRSRQADYFYRVWSAKEACYKMLSSAQQSAISLNQICYSDLIGQNSRGYLYEGSIAGFVVAAMMAVKPETISRNYFLMADEDLQPANDVDSRFGAD